MLLRVEFQFAFLDLVAPLHFCQHPALDQVRKKRVGRVPVKISARNRTIVIAARLRLYPISRQQDPHVARRSEGPSHACDVSGVSSNRRHSAQLVTEAWTRWGRLHRPKIANLAELEWTQ